MVVTSKTNLPNALLRSTLVSDGTHLLIGSVMAQEKNTYTKHQLAEKLGIQTYIMDAWEKQFEIEPAEHDGTKVYTHKHLAQFCSIKELLYERGLALDAAKKYFKDQSHLEGAPLMAASPLNFQPQKQPASPYELLMQPAPHKKQDEHLRLVRDRLSRIRNQLQKLSNSL